MKTVTHQTPEEIIKSASPAQKILWNYIFRLCGERAGITQLHYKGVIAGTEFLNYDAHKIYLALDLILTTNNGVLITRPYFQLMDENNVGALFLTDNSGAWDTTAASFKFYQSSFNINNVYFSRGINQQFLYMSFTGYKISF